MDTSFFLSLHFLWIILAGMNLVIQLAYFYNDQSSGLFAAKKATTPLLLFFALLIVVMDAGGFPLIPCLILAAMGIGELGIEGSSVVQSKKSDAVEEPGTSPVVVLAGVLFLLVNVFIGVYLMMQKQQPLTILISLLSSCICISLIYYAVIRIFNPSSDLRFQIALYAAGVAILFAGALTDVYVGISLLGIAALILTTSDLLVLIRMGAGFSTETSRGFKTLLAFLVGILLLYYVYMGVLIQIGSPFPW